MNPMDHPIITETHERRAHMLLRWRELQSLIQEAAGQKCGIPNSEAVRLEIRLEKEQSSSDWRAAVTVIEDQTKLPRDADDPV